MEAVEFFTELFFGSGAWFGLILILGFMLIVASFVRYSSILWLLILLFLSFEYWGEMGGEISVTSNFMWAVIISYVGMLLFALMLLKDLKFIGNK